MADIDLATILANGEYLKREGDVLVGDIPTGGGGAAGRFDVGDYGAVGDDVHDDTAAFQDCYDAAVAAHGVMRIPTPPVAWRLTGQVDCSTPGPVVIEGDGPTSIIHMDAFPFPVFDVLAPDHTIRDLAAKGTAGRDATGFNDPFRDSDELAYSAVVWTNAANTVVRHIRGETFTSIVKVTAWDIAGNVFPADQTPGIVVEDVYGSDCAFGLLMRSTVGMVWDDIRGTYSVSPGSSRPPHLIYNSDLGPQTLAMRGGSATAIGGLDGVAFQFKNVGPGSTVETLTAKACKGALILATCDGLSISRVVAIEDTYAAPTVQGAVGFIEGCTDCEIGSVRYQGVDDGKPVFIDTGTDDIRILRWKIVSAHTSSQSANVGEIEVSGTNHTIGPGRWIANGAQTRSGVVAYGGSGHRIGRVAASGAGVGSAIRVRDVSTGVTLDDIDPAAQAVLGPVAVYRRERPGGLTIGLDRILVADEFDFPNGTNGSLVTPTVGAVNWVPVTGTWRILTGRAYEFSAGANAAIHLAVGASNVEVSVGVLIPAAGQVGVCISSDTAGTNQFAVTMTTAGVVLTKRVASTYTTISTTPPTYTAGRRYQLTVRKFGSVIQSLVDGALIVTYTLDATETTAIAANTNHGLRCHNNSDGRFDNFVVRSLT